ncbi:MAG TPA: methyl-accepting chemotaxis protein, partial [Turneriella sp.]|nr:methyl-accepting chemotaxis protein [Turneriella sp.]
MKNIISNISFAKKLIALLLLPVLSIAIFAGKEIYRDVSQIADMKHVANLAQMAISGGNLVHALQAERGTSSLFLSSKARDFGQQLQQARSKTDTALAEFRKEARAVAAANARFAEKTEAAEKSLEQLVLLRPKIDGLAIPLAEVVRVYSGGVGRLIDLVAAESRQTSDPRTGSILRGYVMLSNIKELTGRERALLSSVFSLGSFSRKDYESLRDLLQARRTLGEVFSLLAPAESVKAFEERAATDTMKKFVELENIALSAAAGQATGVDAKNWYKVATKRIEDLREAEAVTQKLLSTAANGVKAAASRNLVTDAIIALMALVCAGILSVLIAGNITRRLKGTLKDIDGMVNGDLRIRAQDAGADEIGVFASGLNRLVERMHAVLHAVHEASDSIRDSSGRLNQTAHVLSTGTEETSVQSRLIADATLEVSQKLESLSSAIQEMSISIGEISTHGAQAA